MNMMASAHGSPVFTGSPNLPGGRVVETVWGEAPAVNQPHQAAPAPQENDAAARPANFVQVESIFALLIFLYFRAKKNWMLEVVTF